MLECVRAVEVVHRVIEPGALFRQCRDDEFPEHIRADHAGEIVLHLRDFTGRPQSKRRECRPAPRIADVRQHCVVGLEDELVDLRDLRLHPIGTFEQIHQQQLAIAELGESIDVLDQVREADQIVTVVFANAVRQHIKVPFPPCALPVQSERGNMCPDHG